MLSDVIRGGVVAFPGATVCETIELLVVLSDGDVALPVVV